MTYLSWWCFAFATFLVCEHGLGMSWIASLIVAVLVGLGLAAKEDQS